MISTGLAVDHVRSLPLIRVAVENPTSYVNFATQHVSFCCFMRILSLFLGCVFVHQILFTGDENERIRRLLITYRTW